MSRRPKSRVFLPLTFFFQQSAGEDDTEYKKPRTEQLNADSSPDTPLKRHNVAFPSPLTHGGSTATEVSKDGTATPPPKDSDATKSAVDVSQRTGLSSPPSDTQPFSQFVYPPGPWYEVQDEDGEGVWGYLVPMDEQFGEVLVLRRRSACPVPGQPPLPSGKAVMDKGVLEEQEAEYEKKKQKDGVPAGGYLIGRHPECGMYLCPFGRKSIGGTLTTTVQQIASSKPPPFPIATACCFWSIKTVVR